MVLRSHALSMSAVLSSALVQIGLWGFLIVVSSLKMHDAKPLVDTEA